MKNKRFWNDKAFLNAALMPALLFITLLWHVISPHKRIKLEGTQSNVHLEKSTFDCKRAVLVQTLFNQKKEFPQQSYIAILQKMKLLNKHSETNTEINQAILLLEQTPEEQQTAVLMGFAMQKKEEMLLTTDTNEIKKQSQKLFVSAHKKFAQIIHQHLERTHD